MAFEIKRLCIKCKEKEPSVDTVLEIGVNIAEGRYNRSDYTCDDCYKARQKGYQLRDKERWADYLRHLKDETVEELTTQWNDPHFSKIKEPADKVRKIWDKYDRRSPEKGVRRDWICEVIYSDLWYIDANGIVEDFFNQTNKSKSQRLAAKPYLLEFVANDKVLYLLQAAYKDKARNRWNSTVDAIARKYAGRDKIVASPPYEDPYTKEFVDNWYLLSRDREREIREMKRNAKIERLHVVTIDEKELVDKRIRAEQRKRHKAEAERQSDDEQSNQGGDTE